MTRFYECRYVRREDPGDLLWGYIWRPAILVDDLPHYGEFLHLSTSEIEALMVDKETGKPVGDTRNFCIDPHCGHNDCAPMTLLVEIE